MHPIDYAWAVLKADEVVIDGVTYVPQQEQAQQEQPQQEQPQQEQPSFWHKLKTLGSHMTSDNRGLRGLRNPKQTVEGIQQQLTPPNPQADSPLAAEEPEERPRSIMDLGQEEDPDAW